MYKAIDKLHALRSFTVQHRLYAIFQPTLLYGSELTAFWSQYQSMSSFIPSSKNYAWN